MVSEHSADRVLRAKYLDWCSARLADRFLALTPDEIYQLAERASHGREDAFVASGASGLSGPDLSAFIPPSAVPAHWRDPDSFRVLVARVTDVLADTLELPTFEEWTETYRRDPEAIEAELLGFWKDAGED